jgi:hypothetical protein
MKVTSREPALSIFAGQKALTILRDEGLRLDRVKVLAGAAGGPKWLVLHGMDKALFTRLTQRRHPLFLIGASIGTWRFLCAAMGDGALGRFREAYIEQRYRGKPTPRKVTEESLRILKQLMGKCSAEKALAHPVLRLNILTVRSRHLVGDSRNIVQSLGLTGAVFANLAQRKLLRYFFERTLFYDQRGNPPFSPLNDFPTRQVPLSPANLLPAVLASGSIPLVMEGIQNIPGALAGTYRDGGMIDYHIDIDLLKGDDDSLILYPHYTDRIVPGWLDKRLAWRTPVSASMDNLVLLAPSRAFVSALPFGKIPDRDDFVRFFGQDAERIAYWRAVVAAGERIAEEFMEAMDSGKIRERVKPLPWKAFR